MWRDPLRPSQILAKLCKDYKLEGPFYAPNYVRVGEKAWVVPFKTDPGGASKVDSEPIALYALQHWDELHRSGFHLVPEHVEVRPLYHPEKPGIEQGRLEMWIDMFPLDMPPPPPPVAISPRKPKRLKVLKV